MARASLKTCLLFASLATTAGLAFACSSTNGGTTFATTSTGSSTSSGAGGVDFDGGTGTGGPPPLDAGGLCGNQLHQLVYDAPNVYFILDTSGSMIDPADGKSGKSKYDVVQAAIVQLVHDLGPKANVGVALFPYEPTMGAACKTGAEVMSVRPGDPYSNTPGPVTMEVASVTNVTPAGGTPTAATLRALQPGLAKLHGRTIVVLATDGGPNCDPNAMCNEDECTLNIEGYCQMGTNCCAPGGLGGPSQCVDRAATVSAIGAIASANIQVFVVGIPGSQAYAKVLDAMALAGGGANFAEPYYNKVDDLNQLGTTLGSIAGQALSCDFDVKDPPKEPDLTNVYLDGTILPYDPSNGWIWKTPSQVEIEGAACASVKSGLVKQVQIVSGCPTEKPK